MARIAGMTQEQVAEHAARVRQTGYTVLEQHLPVETR